MSLYSEELTLLPNFSLERPEVTPGHLRTFVDPETGLALDTYTVDGRKAGSRKTIALFQPWSDYVGRPFAQQRMDLIADSLNARVIGVDNLGVGLQTSDIPEAMRAQIASGDFSEVNRLQWAALQSGGSLDELTLAYYSLGTSMAMSMAAHAPEGVQIDRMMLWDCAAIEPQNFGRLALTYFMNGAQGWKRYLSENPEWVEEPSGVMQLVKRISLQPAGHYYYPRGMARKTAFDDMQMAHEKGSLSPDSLIHVINGSKSKVSPSALNDALANKLTRLRHPTPDVLRLTLRNEYHAIQDSFPRTQRVLGHVARLSAL